MTTLQQLGYHQQQGNREINVNQQENAEIYLDQPQSTQVTETNKYNYYL
jgi:hypothetical protein